MNSLTPGTFLKYVLPLILYCGFIFFISSLSAPPAPDYGFVFSDKINHAGAYGIMMLLAFRASSLLFRDSRLRTRLLAALIFTLLYGASDEIHQYFVPNRECDLLDWLADATGAMLAIGAILLVRHRRIGALLFGSEVTTES
jgi:VanZ family protein